MEIIALVGPSSSGKTTTINIVYQILLSQKAQSTCRKQEGDNPADFSDILLWKGKKIAFYTIGDYSRLVIRKINFYNAQKCDKYICACNDRFVRPLNEYRKYNTTIINKVLEPNDQLRQANDNRVAQSIFILV